MSYKITIPEEIAVVDGNEKLWHHHVNKVPKMPRGYQQEQSNCWRSLAEALAMVGRAGAGAGLVYNLKATKFRPADLDPDKESGKLRDCQLELIDHYTNTYPTLIMKSTSGIGYHIWFYDPEDQLSAIGSGKVVSGVSPCEIKNVILYITGNIVNNVAVARPDKRILDIVAKASAAKPKPKPRVAKKTTAKKPRAKKTAKSKTRSFAFEFVQSFRDLGKPLCPTNSDFERVVCILATCGLSEEEIIEICSHEDGYDSNAPDRITSFAKKVAGGEAQISSAIAYAKEKGVQIGLPKGAIVVPPKYASGHAYEYCLDSLGIEFRHNELAIVSTEVKLAGCDKWRSYDDDVANEIFYDHVQKRCFYKQGAGHKEVNYGKEIRFEVARNVARKKPYNSVKEWFANTPAERCDKVVDRWFEAYVIDHHNNLADAGKTTDQIKEYYRAGFLSIAAGIYRRTMHPGCLHDIFVVLSGSQGCGKGLGLKLLLPPESIDKSGYVTANRAFRSQLKFQKDMNNEILKLQTCVLAEFQELIGHNRVDNEAFKAFVSEDTDIVRRAYDRELTSYPRKCVMIGTTNESQFKPLDATGDRRTFPIELGSNFATRKEVSVQLPQIFNDEWRKAWWGHVMWLVGQGYAGLEKDWSDNVRDCRDILVNATTRSYADIVHALNGLALQFFSASNQNRKLPFNPRNTPPGVRTLMTMLGENYPNIVSKHRPENIKFVAVKQLGWGWDGGSHRVGDKTYRGWITVPELEGDISEHFIDKEVLIDNGLRIDRDAEEAKLLAESERALDAKYLEQKLRESQPPPTDH